MADPPPPPPPPHGQNPRPPGGLPDGNYDIFIIPPHSAGGGFLYLPSMQPHRNSFLLGVACTLLVVGVWTLAMPVLRQWANMLFQSGGLGVLLLIVGVGVAGWAWGKTQGENNGRPGPGSGSSGTNSNYWQQSSSGPAPGGWTPPKSSPQPDPRSPPPRSNFGDAPKSNFGASSSGWEKAKEETRKREEERKRAEELKKKAEEVKKAREEAERAAKAKAEKEKWEQARAREKDQREREARERIAKEREARGYQRPTAKSAAGTETAHSYRPYDPPPKKSTYKSSAASSVSGVSEGSYAPSQSTARTTPPPSMRGPYSTDDPDKIQIKAVYLFSDSFPTKPQSQLIARQGSVTDGLILRIKTEGLFIDDDIRGVPQREWDVKAWTLKLVEDGMTKTSTGQSLHVLRATARDADNKKYTFVLDEKEGFKVAIGLAKLRKGSQVRSLGMNGMKEPEVKGLLTSLGWM